MSHGHSMGNRYQTAHFPDNKFVKSIKTRKDVTVATWMAPNIATLDLWGGTYWLRKIRDKVLPRKCALPQFLSLSLGGANMLCIFICNCHFFLDSETLISLCLKVLCLKPPFICKRKEAGWKSTKLCAFGSIQLFLGEIWKVLRPSTGNFVPFGGRAESARIRRA